MRTARWLHLGRMDYTEAWDVQLRVLDEVMAGLPPTLITVEHPPVYTLGANFHQENMLFSEQEYAARGVTLVRTDRGGDVTYHGPGQLVQYPIFNVSEFGKDLHRWMRDLEETQLSILRHFGVEGRRFPPHTGAWAEDRKVAAIGVKIRRWVSLHGIALNCDSDLAPFGWIVPCGIADYGVTSLTQLLGRAVTVEEALPVCIESFEATFGLRFEPITVDSLGGLAPGQGPVG